MFPRQSGKNELQAQLETYLLCCFYLMDAEMVKVSPTWKPQTLNAMRRLERVLSSNLIAGHLWTKESGYIYRCGKARIYFFSGQPRSNIVGATANILLEVDEAQDVLPAKFDKDIAPMAASTNATRVFWGTAWTSRTLLARELRAARKAQQKDGIQRVFVLTADDVSSEVPAYGDFVAGLTINCKQEKAAAFLSSFWTHRLNRMPVRVFEMCDELTRTGNLFIMLSTDPAGMSYLRVIPASQIDEIQSRQNDIEQPVLFKLKATAEDLDPAPVPAYDPQTDNPQEAVMLHYAINRPAGAQWGEPDLAPLLRWLARYSNWLEDRARLNRYRNSFLFVVQAKFASEAQRKARQTALNANPPKPGSILVADENETWRVLHPRLESGDAEKDGLAIKKMISAGAGIPLHFLAEPESATRTTAEAAGGPTYRRFEQRQEYFLWMVQDILSVVLARRGTLDPKVKGDIEFSVTGADISSNDNGALSQAAYYMISILDDLRDRSLITNSEFLRLIYRFFGETVDADDMLQKAAKESGEQGKKPDSGPQGKGVSDGYPSELSARAESGDP
jgi:hypothetical protein